MTPPRTFVKGRPNNIARHGFLTRIAEMTDAQIRIALEWLACACPDANMIDLSLMMGENR